MLVFSINASSGNAICVGLTYYFLYLLIGPITGSHANPSVTLGVWINKDKSWHSLIQLANYTFAQTCGALMSCSFILQLVKEVDEDGNVTNGDQIIVMNPSTANIGQAFIVECFVTFIFVYSYMIVKDFYAKPFHNKGINTTAGWFSAMTAGLSLAAMLQVGGPHTGGSLNPAISIAQQVLADTIGFTAGSDVFWRVYMLGPMAGSILAGLFSQVHSNLLKNFANRDDEIEKLFKKRAEEEEAAEKAAKEAAAAANQSNAGASQSNAGASQPAGNNDAEDPSKKAASAATGENAQPNTESANKKD